MNAKDAFKISMDMSDYVLKTYVSDLSDEDLLVRVVPGLNHIAWQLGHLISAERQMLSSLVPNAGADLPHGFDAAHDREKTTDDSAASFCGVSMYLELYDMQRLATKHALESMPDARLDDPGPESFRDYAPTIGAVFNLIATHPMMHVGQFVAVRRKLGKPVLI